jgi:flavin-dependent dehydrogenase
LGGGPAGTATAIALLMGGRALGRELQITVVEGKRFVGEHHHNLCTGVLAPPLMDLLEKDLCVPFPYHLRRDTITGFVLHTVRREIILDGEEGDAGNGDETSVALRRVQFDAYMLEAARERGVEVLEARANGLELGANGAVVYTDSSPLDVDVVVGAFGLDEGTAAVFHRAVGYRPPPALTSVVTKYHPGESGMQRFGHRIHAFLPPTRRIEFGAITPKGNHLTINLAGADVDSGVMDAFLVDARVRGALPDLENAGKFDPQDLRHFKGRFPRGLAHRFTGDRYVMVGDAAGLVRAFKGKGVTSAFQSGIRAADTILHQGISKAAFETYLEANGDIIHDLVYGQAFRHFAILAARSGLMDLIVAAAQRDQSLRQALFDAVSAHRSYRQVLRESLSPASVRAVVAAMFSPLPN